MEIKYLNKSDKKITFVAKGIDFTQANAIRRAVLTYVPAMAVDRVTFYENTSPLYEEMLAQRFGLVPLTTDLKTYQMIDDKYKPGDARYEVSLILEKEGPATVYSGDLKSQDAKVKPVFDKIPLLKLAKDQKIKTEMTARLGLMTEHAKYQAANCAYKQLKEDEFEFFVESYNNFSAKDILDVALQKLEEQTDDLEKTLTKKK